MKIMPCPLNGPRDISEFICGGEVKEMPDVARGGDLDWAAYLFLENNTRGMVREWWFHAPSSYWFIAERNTETDEIVNTYPVSDLFPEQNTKTKTDGKAIKETKTDTKTDKDT